jgi:hypothetical protein
MSSTRHGEPFLDHICPVNISSLDKTELEFYISLKNSSLYINWHKIRFKSFI